MTLEIVCECDNRLSLHHSNVSTTFGFSCWNTELDKLQFQNLNNIPLCINYYSNSCSINNEEPLIYSSACQRWVLYVLCPVEGDNSPKQISSEVIFVVHIVPIVHPSIHFLDGGPEPILEATGARQGITQDWMWIQHRGRAHTAAQIYLSAFYF